MWIFNSNFDWKLISTRFIDGPRFEGLADRWSLLSPKDPLIERFHDPGTKPKPKTLIFSLSQHKAPHDKALLQTFKKADSKSFFTQGSKKTQINIDCIFLSCHVRVSE